MFDFSWVTYAILPERRGITRTEFRRGSNLVKKRGGLDCTRFGIGAREMAVACEYVFFFPFLSEDSEQDGEPVEVYGA